MSKGAAPSMAKSDDDWRGESDHRTVMEAAEITADKRRMSGVKKHHRKMTKKMSLVQRNLMQGRR